MKLIEIFNALTNGELSQISIGGIENGEISEKNYYAVLSHINLGLTALYKRFPLQRSKAVVPLVPGTVDYTLALPDLLKVEAIYTDAGFELPLNDESEKYSVFTPAASRLSLHPDFVAQGQDLNDSYKTTGLNIVYRVNHPIINADANGFDPYIYEVQLPYSHLEPLLYYVASRVNNPIGMVNEFHAGSSYAAKYEQACQQLEVSNLRVDQFSQPDRISRGGWV